MIKIATIAGSDASGGAGLEADLKTFEEYGLYGMAAVTLIATMDPNDGWSHRVFPIEETALRAQLETIFKGVEPSAAKSGMLGSSFAVELTREYIAGYGIKKYVLDPVMVCKGAGEALHPELNAEVAAKLLPLAELVTPNLFEAGQLAGMAEIRTLNDMERAARIIVDKGARAVYVKGGSKLPDLAPGKAVDLYFDGRNAEPVEGTLLKTAWTHGAGCTTAAAIASGLALGLSTREAVFMAKRFITNSLAGSFPLNRWVGPGNPSQWRSEGGLFRG